MDFLSRMAFPLRGLILASLLVLSSAASAQMTPDQQAQSILASARRAYNEKNYPFAAARFREFLTRFGGHREANSARFGLALALLEAPERDADKAFEQLAPLLGQKSFPEHAHVLYQAGAARRLQGVKALDLAQAKPAEATGHQGVARQRFEDASKHFADAAVAFLTLAKGGKVSGKGLAEEQEWHVRSRCDQAEMLLRINKPKEAREAVAAVLTDKEWQKSRYHTLGNYYLGFASFLLGDGPTAGKALNRTIILSDEVFGTHARYLVARLHHQNRIQDEREEARQAYQAVLRDHEAQKKNAQERLRQPVDAASRSRLERLVRGPAPDHIGRATFFLAVLQYEDGRFSEALEHFKNLLAQHPNTPLAPEARLRMGFCQVQLKQHDEALKTLTPLSEKEPALADQALYFMAKAQLAKGDPAKPDSLRPALDTFRRAADRANQLAGTDPRARTRRGEILSDLAEGQQLGKFHREAVSTYSAILQEKLLPGREDETMLGLATAHQVDGNFAESDRVCARFLEQHKDSPLTSTLRFRHAENAALQAVKAEQLPNPADRARESARHNDEAIKRYTVLIERSPDAGQVQLARHGLGMTLYRKGELDKARVVLESIPAAERSGELAAVSYSLADIALRQVPSRADDALAAGKMEEKLRTASDLLEAYLSAVPESPQVPDVLLKVANAQQRLARILAQPADKQKALAAGRAACERVQQKYAKHPAYAQATFERARILASMNEIPSALNELRRFATEDGLKKAPVAPMALLHLATLQRGQNRPAEAVATLAECRKNYEPILQGDPARQSWVPLIQYHHAAALREVGKLDEARTLFEQVARTPGERPEIWDAALRAGQCQKESGEKKLAEGKKQLQTPGLKPEQRAMGEKLLAEGNQELRNAVTYLSGQEQAQRTRKVSSEDLQRALGQTRSRLMYESAWGWRSLAEIEIETARRNLQLERWQRRRDELARATPAGQTPPPVAMPEVALSEVARQPAEAQVRARYQELVKTFPELGINADARFELAEVLCDRGEHDEAVKLLQGALEAEKEPSPELMDRIKLRLGSSLLDRGSRKLAEAARKRSEPGQKQKAAVDALLAGGRKDIEQALEQLQPVSGNPKSAVLAHATYREAECLLQLARGEEAVKLLVKFRDHGPFQNLPGLSDRALLRLGWVLGERKQWDLSRQAYETLLGRFGSSPWRHEARYGIGWAWQNQGQYDNAIQNYNEVTGSVATELGARAQLNVGMCRLVQKRFADAGTALLVVPFTYDYPELSALALLEAARAFNESKQPDQAVRLLRRVLRDHAGTAHAEAARKRLAELGES